MFIKRLIHVFCISSICFALLSSFTKIKSKSLYSFNERHIDDSESIDDSLNLIDKYKEITFVSSNLYKVREVKLILGEDFPWEVKCENIELVEPQATAIEISIAKCQQAVTKCQGPVIVEDTSLCFNALGGLPGVYIKWHYEALGNLGL